MNNLPDNNNPRNIVPKSTTHSCILVANIKYLLFSKARIFEKRIIPIVAGITVNDIIWITKIDSLNLGKTISIKIGDKTKLITEIIIENRISIFFNCLFFLPVASSGTKYLYDTDDTTIRIV